jgi:hypothetical protein
LRPNVNRAILRWGLSDNVFVEVRLRLNSLANNPARQLVRTTEPIDGMSYTFGLIDPQNRLCEHFFRFHVLYGQDEETIYVVGGTHFRQIG